MTIASLIAILLPDYKRGVDSHQKILNKYKFSDNENFFTNKEDKAEEYKNLLSFHCWKCGYEAEIDSLDCWNCETTLSIPDEKKVPKFQWEEINGLISKGRRQGFFLYEEINEVFHDEIYTKKDFNEFLNTLDNYGIEIRNTEK